MASRKRRQIAESAESIVLRDILSRGRQSLGALIVLAVSIPIVLPNNPKTFQWKAASVVAVTFALFHLSCVVIMLAGYLLRCRGRISPKTRKLFCGGAKTILCVPLLVRLVFWNDPMSFLASFSLDFTAFACLLLFPYFAYVTQSVYQDLE